MNKPVLFDYWRSSASYRVRIALNLAAIDYDAVVVDLVGGEHKGAEHLARNPQGFVPVLDVDGHRLTQSLAILDYLDRTRQLNLLPNDAVERARVQALAYAIAVDIHPVCNLSVARHATSLSKEATDMPGDWMRHFIRPGLQAFETMLGTFEQAPYCTGSQPSLADICLIPQLYNARRWQVELSDMPRVLGVEAACASHPAFVAAHPDAHAPQ
ncbi:MULTISPECIES: maleylacetoacetate isomerase [unclassified Ruegeria]|uniref:maleylacetoacetate isomerase n=1 Tax=unclassified Ruegeria TaxID=2625375 RepID=UPI0014892FD6|nr:maleylacetoacetate isomerase [Ruegeria sp. HKCCD4332]NOD90670.1 maleylacetoacetate isomerase [Ruegeria sp. HKCCD4318]NOE15827.1 maleylacetoacetate isomerase [Ruegeria sp. HKCCD4318-2]NOG07899.1 maleylacetoacetate isomerase [Ruegeria sp. HKCCD4315]